MECTECNRWLKTKAKRQRIYKGNDIVYKVQMNRRKEKGLCTLLSKGKHRIETFSNQRCMLEQENTVPSEGHSEQLEDSIVETN